jgi:hypothetical protein
MTDHTQSAKDTAATFGSLIRRGFAFMRAEIVRQREEARTLAAEQEARRDLEWSNFEAANDRAERLLQDLLAAYVPKVTQEGINSITWSVPNLIAEVLEAEIYRIHDILRPFMQEAGFPLGTKDKLLDDKMEEVWKRAHATFHEKAFSHLSFPRYFCFRDGILGYEPIRWKKQYLYHGYVGVLTGYRYSNNRVLAPVSS